MNPEEPMPIQAIAFDRDSAKATALVYAGAAVVCLLALIGVLADFQQLYHLSAPSVHGLLPLIPLLIAGVGITAGIAAAANAHRAHKLAAIVDSTPIDYQHQTS